MQKNEIKNTSNVTRTKSNREDKLDKLNLISTQLIIKLLESGESEREKHITDLEERIIKECDRVGANKEVVNLYLEDFRDAIKQIIDGGHEINTMKLNEAIKNQQF